eukprot:11197313-Lingulodinium_polyedra.AAC.1
MGGNTVYNGGCQTVGELRLRVCKARRDKQLNGTITTANVAQNVNPSRRHGVQTSRRRGFG